MEGAIAPLAPLAMPLVRYIVVIRYLLQTFLFVVARLKISVRARKERTTERTAPGPTITTRVRVRIASTVWPGAGAINNILSRRASCPESATTTLTKA